MKLLKQLCIFAVVLPFVMAHSTDKNIDDQDKIPFKITDTSYFYWIAGKKASNGIKIQIAGTFETRNLEFNTIYFHNREIKVVPQISVNGFTIVGGYTILNSEGILDEEYSQNTSKKESTSSDIPFELEENEAVLVYQINGKNFYYKIKDIKKLDTVFYP